MLRTKLDEERRIKREQVEEFKYRKEIDKQREKQIQDMEKRRTATLTQEQKERLFKREEEVFTKKHQLIIQK